MCIRDRVKYQERDDNGFLLGDDLNCPYNQYLIKELCLKGGTGGNFSGGYSLASINDEVGEDAIKDHSLMQEYILSNAHNYFTNIDTPLGYGEKK